MGWATSWLGPQRTHVVVSGRDAGGDIEVPVFDGAALLLREQLCSIRNSDILLCLVGNEVYFEAVEAGGVRGAGVGCSRGEVTVTRYLSGATET